LKSSPATAYRAVFGCFLIASRKACVVGADSAPNLTTTYANLQGFYGSDGTRTRDLRRDRPVMALPG
jgi:hypothetical protein